MTRLVLLLLLISLMGCEKCDPPDPKENLYVYAEYTNYVGESPKLTVKANETSKFITYGVPEVFPVTTTSGNRIRIRIPDLKVKIDDQSYDIKKIIIEENKSGEWKVQEEFSQNDSAIRNKLAVAMVLDMSTSLGTDINAVKQNANNFSSQLLSPGNGYLGLVLFNEQISPYQFTTSSATVSSRINSYTTYRNATTLYGAMNTGLAMLDTFNQVVDKKVLLTFTDGGDNNTNNPTTARNNILNSKFERYTIGLRGKGGDYVESDLKAMSNYFVAADNINSVNGAFNEILKKITTTSIIKYDRTAQQFTRGIDPPVQVRYKLVVE